MPCIAAQVFICCRDCLPLTQAAQVDGEAGEDLVIGPALRQAQRPQASQRRGGLAQVVKVDGDFRFLLPPFDANQACAPQDCFSRHLEGGRQEAAPASVATAHPTGLQCSVRHRHACREQNLLSHPERNAGFVASLLGLDQ